MKSKTTKRALLSSCVALMLCFSMLLGTTYAWFTDSVTSANNIIKSGTLDVEMYWADGTKAVPAVDSTDWTDASTGAIFKSELWEPGFTEVRHIKIENKGTLALKYALNILPTGEVSKLAEVIDVYFLDPAQQIANRSDLANMAVQGTLASVLGGMPANTFGTLASGQSVVVTMALKMQEEAGNDYQDLAIGSDFSVQLLATQLEAEPDSFGNDYDGGAAWYGEIDLTWYEPDADVYEISSAADLAGLAAIVNGTAVAPVATFAANAEGTATLQDSFKGKTIKLVADLELNGVNWTPIGRIGTSSTDFTYAFKGTFDGQNHTISNLEVHNEGWAGVFGLAHSAQINNLKVKGISITSNRMTGAVVGQLYGSIDNCHVEDAEIMVTPNAVGDTYDNGDKVGGIVGWIGDNGNNRTLTNCSAVDVKLGAYRDVGGIAGYAATSTTISGNKVDNLEIAVDQKSYYYGDKDFNAGAIWGRGTDITDGGNTQNEVTITSTYTADGVTYKEDGVTNDVTLYLVPADYESDTVTVAEGTTTIGGYAFAYNSNIEKIVLSSTVTTLNDRAFRDTSASDVVLNEGLTNISYQAFRNALNVTTVEIPSTVKTISKEAFQNSGITTLTIPANVTTIEYGGLRDMKMLEQVVIEGNVDIPVYAFRACTNLKTVILKGDDVTFGGGSRGMIFTNKENGDGSAITVFVENETVKERLLAADTAAKDYGGYTIIVGMTAATDKDSLAAALDNGKDVVLTADIDATSGIAIPEGATLNGNGHTITYAGTEYDYHLVKLNTGAALQNITLENYRVRTEDTTNGVVTMENVVINMDNDLTGLDISRGEGTAKLTNVECAGITDATHLDPNTTVQVDYTPYGDVLLGTKWGLDATNCKFGSLHGWNTTNGSNVSLNNTTYTVFRMHYWNNRTLYIDGVETAWSASSAIPVAHDVGGCWSVQPAFK